MNKPNIRARLSSWFPLGWVRHILRDGAAYLDRYTVFKQGPSGTNPWRIYLHRFHAADGPDFHNHPSKWSFSIVLRGSYTEEILEKYCTSGPADGSVETCGCGQQMLTRVVSRRVRWFNYIPADKFHRITRLHPRRPGGCVWSLFICGPLTGRGWGFMRPGGQYVPADPQK